MNFFIDRARAEDIDQLLRLYYVVYDGNYPLAFGKDRVVALKTIQSEYYLWLVARDQETGTIGGALLFDIDPVGKIGKVEGLVVLPEYRKQKLASLLVETGTAQLISENGPINSIYTTTRTNSVGVQVIFLRNGYLPLGIFPNAHKIKEYETLTLFAKFRPGVLEHRAPVEEVPHEVGGLLQAMEQVCGISTPTRIAPPRFKRIQQENPMDFEFIYAPEYVKRKFNEKMSDPYDRFYPFHTPNFLISSTNSELEIYAYFSKPDHYCAIVSLTAPLYTLEGRLSGLLNQLNQEGISYFEVLLGLQHTRSLETAITMGFTPSAFYPAMTELEGTYYDFVVLSRTLAPLNFNGMAIEKSFKPFIDNYIRNWVQKYLDCLEVVNGN